MAEKIKFLFDDRNIHAIPKCIWSVLVKLDRTRSYSYNKSTGESKNGDLTLPVIGCFDDDNFFMIGEHYDNFINYRIPRGVIDDKNNPINTKRFSELLKYYGEGFRDGYFNFLQSIKSDSIFSKEDEVIAYKIFSKVNSKFTTASLSFIPMMDVLVINSKEYSTKITDETLRKDGKKFGELYKAWETILDNIPIFEPIFEKYCTSVSQENIKDKSDVKELPEIDLSSQNEQIRLLHELGIFEYLRDKYPSKLKANNQLATLIATILKLQRSSIQPSINALLNDNATSKNYPKKSSKTDLIINSLNNDN